MSSRDRLGWMALASIPAGLVIAVTSYITTDIAAAPFLWVLPLALYLLTFVAVFRDKPWIPHATIAVAAVHGRVPLAISLLGGNKSFWLGMIVINLLVFFLFALACHGELYRRRPAPARLTEFYLWTSFGGVLGGIFAALVAPLIFNGFTNIRSCSRPCWSCRRRSAADQGISSRRPHPALAVAAVAVAVQLIFAIRLPAAADMPFLVALVMLAAIMLLHRRRPARFFGALVLAFVADRAVVSRATTGSRQRAASLAFIRSSTPQTAAIGCSSTAQRCTAPSASSMAVATAPPEPLTYYYFGGPISEGIAAMRAARGGLRHVAVVGLGTGSLACHKRDNEPWTFYEIDPDVVRIARDRRLFSFLSVCAPGSRSCSATRGLRWQPRSSAMTSSSSTPFPPTRSPYIC